MRVYCKDRIYSFKFTECLLPEVAMTFVRVRHGKVVAEKFYAETTSDPNILAIPARFVCELKDNSPHGFTGKMKEGDFFTKGSIVYLSSPHQVYNNIAYVNVNRSFKL